MKHNNQGRQIYHMRGSRFTAITPKTPNFKVDGVWCYSLQDDTLTGPFEFKIIGVVVEKNIDNVVFKDLVNLKGGAELRYWETRVPLTSGSPDFEFLGEKEDLPEYFL